MEENFADLGHTLQGPHLFPGGDVPAGFVPLHLEIQVTGQRLELARPEIVIGRHSAADVRLAYPDISRRHCRLAFQEGCWRIFDLNSLNGIFLNGERIVEAVLYDGDRIVLGNVVFLVQGSTCVRPHPHNEVLQSIADVLPPQRWAG